MAYNPHDEEVKKEVEDNGDVSYKHPSYGMIRVSRQSGGDGEPLFGSEVGSSSRMSISISEGVVTQHLGRNWYQDRKTITEVVMSPIQYAEMITNPNTQGMPCTIKYTRELGPIKYNSINTQTQYVESKIEEKVTNLKKETSTIQRDVKEILSQKGTLKKADKDSIQRLVRKLTDSVTDALPYYEECLKESIDRMKAEARTEIDGYLTHAITQTGLKALQDPEVLKLVMQDTQNTE